MKVLLVLAHPEPRSFNGALRDAARETLLGRGHEVRESDLYAMAWDPVLGPRTAGTRAHHAAVDGGHECPPYVAQARQRADVAAGTQAPEVVVEQAKLAWADLVIFIFPVWWFGVPAILKGWIDRVFALDVAYGGGRWFDRGVYRGKRALIACTTGAKADRFSAEGLFGPVDWVLHPLRVGTLNFCGFDTLQPFIAWAAGHVSDAARRELLDRWRTRLAGIEHESPQPFRHLADFPSSAMRDHA
ncbi:MAG TPA: NAD(P)H-dependent oxidoreductase [Ramlibacter sp.]|nr:NAD(P)H-dependent oxidoreductase [Ramlibacter sp.]